MSERGPRRRRTDDGGGRVAARRAAGPGTAQEATILRLDHDDPVVEVDDEPSFDPRVALAHLPVVAYSCRVDDFWTCVAISEAVETLFGVSAAAWTGSARGWLERTHPADREALLVARLTACEQRRPLTIEYRLRGADGRYRWVHDEARFQLRDGEPCLLHGVLTDVTARRRSDEVLAELTEESRRHVEGLHQQLEERQEFALLMAHDLRGYLDVIKRGLVDLHGSEPDGQGSTRAMAIHRAVAGVERARGLIHDLLELDRWSRAGILRLEEVHLPHLGRQLAEDVDTGDRATDLDLPAWTASLDPVVVLRALSNLVRNAVDHTPAGGTIRVHAVTESSPPAIVFAVEDEGPGVPDELKERIFEPYVSRSTSGVRDRLGLGLSLVRALARLHGGDVWVEDAPLRGASFRLRIPQPRRAGGR